jgi:subtilisin family serine protease
MKLTKFILLFFMTTGSSIYALTEDPVKDKLTNKLIYIDFKEGKQIIKKEVYNENEELAHTVSYTYKDDSSKPYKFEVVKVNNEKIRTYNQDDLFDLDVIYQDFLPTEKDSRIQIYHQPTRDKVKLMLIDSGVDHTHPDIAYKLFNNKNDILNGIDDDLNGLIDDIVGWSEPQQRGLPIENISTRDKFVPLSHGTHVAGIMLAGNDKASLVPYTGDYGEPFFLKYMNQRLKKGDISFANMSFSFPHWSTQMISKQTYNELRKLISDNPNVLFTSAAGNSGLHLTNSPKLGEGYPAIFKSTNQIVIGALDTSEIVENDMSQYKIASFSNYNNINVDIYAPGVKINSASLGGGYIKHTGTSMAAPWILNHLAKAKALYKRASVMQLRYALLLSAYIPDINNPMSCTSGGMVFPRRFYELIKWYISNNIDTREEFISSALELRSHEKLKLAGESSRRDYVEKLTQIWRKRVSN